MTLFRTCSLVVISCLAGGMPLLAQPLPVRGSVEAQDPVAQALAELNAYGALQQQLGIQQPDVAYGMKKALLLAELLVQPNGALNLALIPQAKSVFVPAMPKEYELQIERVLNQLDTSWQPFFDSVKASADAGSTGNLSLRSLFQLEPGQQITDWHAKVAVLSALLAPYNQGSVGDCFAVNVAIRDHEEYLRHAAEDYQSAVMKGFLERLVDGHPDDFFYLPLLADTDLDQPFALTQDGQIAGTNCSLFDAPGVKAARTVMGGGSIALSDVVRHFSGNSHGSLQATPSQVIEALAQEIVSQSGQQTVQQLQTLGEYAFSSLTNHPVLRGVEAAFSAMAEDRPQDSTRGNINGAVAQSLQDAWTALHHTSGVAAFQNEFNQIFNDSYRLLYNLDIPLAAVSSDGSSTDGGYQLYERSPESIAILGKRIATPEDFAGLVLDAIAKTTQQLGASQDNVTIAQTLSYYVMDSSFMQNVLWNYDPSNKQQPDPVGNYQKLSRTPMQSCDGDNPFEVSDIDTEVDDSDAISYTPSNAKDLVVWAMNLAKKAPPEFCPMVSPQHAFNYVPNTAELSAFVRSGLTADKWLKQTVITPGMQVATRPVSATLRQSMTESMKQLLANALPNWTGFNSLVANLSSQKLTLQQYAANFLAGLTSLLHANRDVANQLSVLFDAALLQSLSDSDAAALGKSAVRFAFTNWNIGTTDLYFCGYFNPRTMQIGFGTIGEDKKGLQPMDEDAWVNHQTWGVDITPQAPKAS